MNDIMRISYLFSTILVTVGFIACSGTRPPVGSTRLVEQVPDEKPKWTWKIPEDKDGMLFFRGFKTRASSLDNGLTDARQNAVQQIVEMVQSKGKVVYAKTRVESGIPEDDRDFGSFIKDGFTLLADNIARGVKESESYYERMEETLKEGVSYHYNYWILVRYPEEEAEGAMRQAAQEQLEKARSKQDSKAEEWAEKLLESLE